MAVQETRNLPAQFVEDLGIFELEVYQSTNYATRFVSITLTSLHKEIKDIMEGARPNTRSGKNKPKNFEDELPFKIELDNPEVISNSINLLEKQMYKYAQETEYERAAFCRDKIKDLKYQLINS